MIRLVIADDHAIVRSGLKEIFALALDLRVAGEAASAGELETLLARVPADILLTDLSMPGGGVDFIAHLRRERPSLPVLVLSMHNEGQIVSRALKAGAAGYVTKDSDPEILISAIRKVAAGGRYIDPAVVEQVVFDGGPDAGPQALLSDREFEVLQLLAEGVSVNEIADRLHLSAKTISTHKARLMQKLGLDNNAELVRYALRHGVLPG